MRETRDPRPPNLPSPESLVEKTALEVGFPLVGVAGISPGPGTGAIFDRWIRAGMHGEMKYLAEGAAKRKAPSFLLDGARSVVCVGLDYYSIQKERWNHTAPGDGRGRIAIYAHGLDYHDVMRGMLAELERRLRGLFPGVETRALVDTEPVSERDMALRAGVGWLGKNTCVISPDFGSWIVLGELVTDLALEPGSPLETLCGDCARCIEACPTGALEAFSLDARKCISYLTVEKGGEIPSEFHSAMADRVFGCDECQRVCPFNEEARESVVFKGEDRNSFVSATIDELVDISNSRFRELARGTAVRRCKPREMRRNARIAAKNRPSLRGERDAG